VTKLALIGGILLGVGLAAFALLTLPSHCAAAKKPTVTEAAIPREQWTMRPLTLLARPKWSTGRKVAMHTMRAYLLVCMILLTVKAVQLGGA